MSRLDELIQQYCPDGVEFKTIGEVCVVLTGGEAPDDAIKGKEPFGDCIYPIYSNGVGENALWGYASSYKIEKVSVTFSSIGTIGYPTIRKGYYTPIIRLKVIYPQDDSQLSVFYLKYALETVEFEKQKSSVPNINANMIKAISIPLPPLPVQEEIVRILDNFTELQAELQAELQKRKQQYNYYLDNLLNFNREGASSRAKNRLNELIQQYCPDGVEHYKIKDVYKRIKGTPITAGKMKEIATPDGCVRIFAGGKTVIDANEKDIPNANITRVPAVLVQSRGVIDAVYYDKPFTFKNEMWAYTTFNQKSVKYLYYILKSNIQTFRDAASGMGSLPQISLGVTEEFEIPVPPLPVQEEIVRILDNFNILVNDLTQGLPAEIEKRRLQYEYYRDKLLTFKRKGA